jgi:hypothetical protein
VAHHCGTFCPLLARILLIITSQTGTIDDVHRSVANITEEPKRAEGKSIIADLAKLKYELQHDRKLTLVYPEPIGVRYRNEQ